jgi:Ethanolamine utilisation protein EutA
MHDEDGLEQHTLRSVGIDIGSATSHFTVSRLVVRRRGSALSAEFVVSERETVFRSPVWLTPYRGGDEIDTDRLRALFESGYRAAGIAPVDLEVGAVVITGEALNKRNAEPIARIVADWSGRFVCISAGHNQEAVLAAHGSGAVALSAGIGATVVNLDVGGGTTKFSVVRAGTVTHVEVIGVGARLVAYDEASRVVTRLEHAVRPLLDRLGLDLDLGDRLSTADGARLGELMAAEIVATLTSRRPATAPTLATDGGAMPAPADGPVRLDAGHDHVAGIPDPRGRRMTAAQPRTRFAYDEWMDAQGIPVYRGYFVPDMRAVPLGRWEERGCDAAFVQLVGQEGVSEARITEIPPGETLPPYRMAVDELVYVVSGGGATTLWSDEPGAGRHTFEWADRGMFLVPPNRWRQFSNLRGDQPVGLMSYDYLPLAMSVVPDPRRVGPGPVTGQLRVRRQPGSVDQGMDARV